MSGFSLYYRFGLALLLLSIFFVGVVVQDVPVGVQGLVLDSGSIGVNAGAEDLYYTGYSGRVLRMYGDVIGDLLGLNPLYIIVGAYDGSGWVKLPFRVYDEYMGNNFSIVYTMPERISRDTVIDVRLPGFKPVKVDPYKITPSFARASDGVVELSIYDVKRSSPVAYLYIFYSERGRATYWNSAHYQYLYTVDYLESNDPFESQFMPAVYQLYKQQGYTDGDLARIVRDAIGEVIDVKLRGDVRITATLNSNPLPDGGGGLGYNLIELRPQPTLNMLNEDVSLTYSSNTYSFNLYTIDPNSPSTVKWKYARIVLDLYREEGSGDVVRELVLDINNGDSVTSHPVYAYGDSLYMNKIVVDYMLSPYGSREPAIPISVTLNDLIYGEKWRATITVTTYIIWGDIPVNSLREKPVEYTLIDDTSIEFSVNSYRLIDERTVYLKPLIIISAPDVDQGVQTTLAISSQASQTIYPITLSISLAGIDSCTVTLYDYNDIGYCTLSTTRAGLLSLFSKLDPIPLTFEIQASNYPSATETVTIFIDTQQPLTFKSRMMYRVYSSEGVDQDTHLLTSTRYDLDNKWLIDRSYYIIGRGVYNSIYSINRGTIAIQNMESLLSWQTGETGSTNLKLTFVSGGPPESVTECNSWGCYTITGEKLTGLDILVSLNGFDLVNGYTDYSAKILGSSTGDIIDVEVPPPLAAVLAKVGYIRKFVSQIQTAIWVINLIKQLTSDDFNVNIDYNNDSVSIHWEKGLFSPGKWISMDVYLYNVYIEEQNTCKTQYIDVSAGTTTANTIVFDYNAIICTTFSS
ncbi:MAG: hypothetical protein GSR85_01415 [Desulfurococcales archaeon]|nr:hypothetical protein [Desulfurococcales archaeon]